MTRRRDDSEEDDQPPFPASPRKELRRLRSEIITEKSKVLKPMEDAIAAAEKEIEKNEALCSTN